MSLLVFFLIFGVCIVGIGGLIASGRGRKPMITGLGALFGLILLLAFVAWYFSSRER